MAVDPAERLLNLIIALTHARVRMTRAQIRASVAGYEQAGAGASEADAAKRDAAFERMFERDKDELRRLGVPLRTVVDPTHGDEIGYTIDASEAAMPALDFTPSQLAALAVAAEYWRDATLGQDARQALTKIASIAPATPAPALGLGARPSHSSEALAAIVDARARRQAVAFDYTSTQTGLATRTVEPWHIVLRGPAEYLYGFDRDRKAPRMFRLRRIHGKVRAVGAEDAYEIPADAQAPTWTDDGTTLTATVALRPEAGHRLRARGTHVGTRGDRDLYEVTYRHADELRDEVLALAGAATVVSPAEVAELVRTYAAAAIDVAEGRHG